MSEEKDEAKRGFLINSDMNKKSQDISFYTLKLALKSYFSTYHAMRMNFNIIKEDGNFLETREYIELYIGTIIHFQHFFELFIKSILRDIDERLVVDFVKDPYILYKLIKREKINAIEDKSINTVEFSRALEIFEKLVKKNIIDKKYEFINQHKEEIKKLNTLRNRILHRGIYILPYKDLDIFIVKRILPIVKEILGLDSAKDNQKIWRGKNLDSGLDILNYLCEEGKKDIIDNNSIGLLKELGRSSYNNPLYPKGEGFGNFYEELNRVMIKKYESIAKIEKQLNQVDHIEKCPSCGLNTLVCYFDTEFDYEEFEEQHYVSDYFNVFIEANCTCCSFKINQFVNEDILRRYIGENNIWDINPNKNT